jgi:microcompartment protein CcmK/EutM
MKLCRVIGKANASLKAPALEGSKLLVLQEIDAQGRTGGPLLLAVDAVGAGLQEVVAAVTGSTAARCLGRADLPVDAAVVAIMDHIMANDKEIYAKHEEE